RCFGVRGSLEEELFVHCVVRVVFQVVAAEFGDIVDGDVLLDHRDLLPRERREPLLQTEVAVPERPRIRDDERVLLRPEPVAALPFWPLVAARAVLVSVGAVGGSRPEAERCVVWVAGAERDPPAAAARDRRPAEAVGADAM